MAASRGAVKVFDKDNNLVYEVMAINCDLPCSIELNGNTVKFTSVGSYYVPSNYGDEPSVNTQNISFEPTGSTNQTESTLILPYAPTKIEYFGGSNGDFASMSGQSNLTVNQGETVVTPSGTYDSGGGFALRYYEEAAQPVITLSNLTKFKELCDQTYAKTGGGGENNQIITIGVKSGTLTSDELLKLTNNPAETIFYYDDEDYYLYLSAGTGTSSYTYTANTIDQETGLITQIHSLTVMTSTGAWTLTDYTPSGGGSGGGTQLYRHKLSFDSGTLILISTESRAYNYGSDVQRALVNFAIVSAMFIGEANEGTALLKTSSITVGSVSVYYFATEGTTTLTEVVISRSQSLTDEVTPL